MQHTYYCNGKGLLDYPKNAELKDVNVWIHDSGMVATHDYSCPCCRKKSAVLDQSTGLMQPCWRCQEHGYKLTKVDKRSWWEKLKAHINM